MGVVPSITDTWPQRHPGGYRDFIHEGTAMIGVWRGAVVGSVLLLSCRVIAGEPDDAEVVVARLKASLGAIASVQGTYRTYFSPKTPGTTNSIEPDGHPVPGAIAGPDALILYSEFDWAWQAAPYREAIDGRWGYVNGNRMIYTPAAFFYDGAILRTFNRDGKGGLIKPLDNTFSAKKNPLHLVGIGFGFEPRRNLDALLLGARLVSLPGIPEHVKVLKGDYLDFGQDFELTAWIDTKHGYLPRRIEVLEKARRFVTRRVVNDEIREAAPGVWMAFRVSETGFYAADFRPPPGMTKERYKALDYEARAALLAKLEFVPGTLGLGTWTLIVDSQNLRLNQGIPRARFILNYPEGTRLTTLLTTRPCNTSSRPTGRPRSGARSWPRASSEPRRRMYAGRPGGPDRQAVAGIPGGLRLDQQQAAEDRRSGREGGPPRFLGRVVRPLPQGPAGAGRPASGARRDRHHGHRHPPGGQRPGRDRQNDRRVQTRVSDPGRHPGPRGRQRLGDALRPLRRERHPSRGPARPSRSGRRVR